MKKRKTPGIWKMSAPVEELHHVCQSNSSRFITNVWEQRTVTAQDSTRTLFHAPDPQGISFSLNVHLNRLCLLSIMLFMKKQFQYHL